jgi:hypothetical protein
MTIRLFHIITFTLEIQVPVYTERGKKSMNSQIDNQEDIIHYAWKYMAGWSYDKYMTYGRGAMVITAGAADDNNEDVLKWVKSDLAIPGLDTLIQDYDPETQIVVIFIEKGLPPVFGIHQVDDFPPPQAYIALMKERGEQYKRDLQ